LLLLVHQNPFSSEVRILDQVCGEVAEHKRSHSHATMQHTQQKKQVTKKDTASIGCLPNGTFACESKPNNKSTPLKIHPSSESILWSLSAEAVERR
jgi:hypothetical protein